MSLKSKIEKHNSLLDEIDSLLEAGIVEKRSLTDEEDSKIEDLRKQANELKSEIEEERRSLEVATKVTEKKEGDDIVDNKETELRGLEQFIRGEDGEEIRSMQTTDANAIIPSNLDTDIIKHLDEVAPLFSKVKKFTPMAGTLSIPIEDEVGTAGFVGEGEDTESSKFKLKTIELTQKRAGSEITLSQHLINDAGIDIVSYARELLFRRLGYAINRAMITGTPSNKSIEGLENLPEDRNYEGTLDIELFLGALAHLKAEYQGKGEWIMNRNVFEKVHKLKNAVGELYVSRDVVNGKVTYKLFSLPISISDAVKDDDIFLSDISTTYRGMIKKGASLTKIDNDTQNRRRGTVTLVLDTYIDAKIAVPEASLRLKIQDSDLLSKKVKK